MNLNWSETTEILYHKLMLTQFVNLLLLADLMIQLSVKINSLLLAKSNYFVNLALFLALVISQSTRRPLEILHGPQFLRTIAFADLQIMEKAFLIKEAQSPLKGSMLVSDLNMFIWYFPSLPYLIQLPKLVCCALDFPRQNESLWSDEKTSCCYLKMALHTYSVAA